jgi:hypothetical protein
MNNVPGTFIAIIFFIAGIIVSYLYHKQSAKELEEAIRVWKMQAEITSERLSNWRCLRAHVGDINNIESDIEELLGYTMKKLGEPTNE